MRNLQETGFGIGAVVAFGVGGDTVTSRDYHLTREIETLRQRPVC